MLQLRLSREEHDQKEAAEQDIEDLKQVHILLHSQISAAQAEAANVRGVQHLHDCCPALLHVPQRSRPLARPLQIDKALSIPTPCAEWHQTSHSFARHLKFASPL